MRTFDEILADIQSVRASKDSSRLRQLASELSLLNTPIAAAYAEMSVGNSYLIDGQSTEALSHLEKAARAFKALRDVSCEAGALANSGLCYLNLADFPMSLQRFEQALLLLEETGNTNYSASIYGNIGGVYYQTGNYPEALSRFQMALHLHRESENVGGAGTALGNIGMVYHSIKDYPAALDYYNQSLQVDIQCKNKNGEAMSLGNIGIVQRLLGEHELAIDYLERAIALSESVNATAHAALVRGELISLHIELGNHHKAREILNTQMASDIENPGVKAQQHENIALLAEAATELHEARIQLTEALTIAQRSGLNPLALAYHVKLRDLAKKNGDFDLYVKHNEAYHALNDEIHGQDAIRRLAMIEAKKEIESERAEKEKHRELLYSTLPKSVADRMIRGESVSGDHLDAAAVLFTDVVSFTTHSSSMHPADVVALLATMFSAFDKLCEEHSVIKIKTIGDSYMCFRGDGDATANARSIASLALSLQGACGTWPDGTPILIRIGIHIGPATAGVIGTDRLQYDVWGDTVNVASRLESTSLPGRIHVSKTFFDAFSVGVGHDRPNDAVSVGVGHDRPHDAVSVGVGHDRPNDAVSVGVSHDRPNDAVSVGVGHDRPNDAVSVGGGLDRPNDAVSVGVGHDRPNDAVSVGVGHDRPNQTNAKPKPPIPSFIERGLTDLKGKGEMQTWWMEKAVQEIT